MSRRSSGDNQGNDEGDLNPEDINEDEVDWEFIKGVPWQHHPVRELLQEALINNEIPTDCKLMAPLDVWNKYCDDDIFKGMEYDDAFKRRLLALRKQVRDGKDRADSDLQYFNTTTKITLHPLAITATSHSGMALKPNVCSVLTWTIKSIMI